LEKETLLVGFDYLVPDYPDLDILDQKLENLLMALDMPPSLVDLDKIIETSSKNSKLFKSALRAGVRDTQEFKRIYNVERRIWTPEAGEALAVEMTQLLKTPTGTMKLRPIQAIALLEMGVLKGLVGPMRAGAGKTLVTFLAPYVMNAKRPILLMPAKLIDIKRAQLAELAKHWKVAYWLVFMSYESLSRVKQKFFLDITKPDLVLADEGHKLKNPKASVTKVVKKYIKEAKVPYATFSGTFTTRSIQDYAPQAEWALHEKCPVPIIWSEVEEWGNAIDERPRTAFRMDPGALSKFADGKTDLASVREGFQRRVTETPGVVATYDKLTNCSLTICRSTLEAPSEVKKAFALLREKKERPDGWAFASGLQVAEYERQLALGFYYKYKVNPPMPWLASRRSYAYFSRYVLTNNRQNINSELQVRNAYDRGDLDYYREKLEEECGPDPLGHWRKTKPEFIPEQEVVWLSEYALDYCATWLKEPGIVWVRHVEFAETLSRKTGIPYAGAGGTTKDGIMIEHLEGKQVIASIGSNQEGRDLQAWDRCLVTASMGGAAWEQLLARVHRDGTEKEEVTYEALSLCAAHESGFQQALLDADYIAQTTKQEQRLRYADVIWPESKPDMYDPIFNKDFSGYPE
jgi:hypothetical protein